MVDGDTVFEPQTVTRLMQPLADARVAAVAGNTKVGNRSGLLGRWQHIEYVMGFTSTAACTRSGSSDRSGESLVARSPR